jgi:hypothetical protein
MSDADETLRREIFETKQNAQESWLHVRCSKMLDALGALKMAHAEAIKAARAEGYAAAREQAARLLQGQHYPPCYERPVTTETTVGECGNCARARVIRAMQDEGGES